MFAPNPSTTSASQPGSPDIQQLVGLLGNLMPLLLRFQSQGFQSQGFQSQGLEQPFQGAPGNALMPNPALDHRAAENLIGDMTAGSLRALSAYLEANAGRHAALESCIPIVTQAAQRFAARDYGEAFNLIWLAYRVIETIRAADQQIPPLRSGSTPVDQTSSSVH
jgi:ectoine hydroxylase-related dioxygenase (phytanoyl-CoA dioxygenase family)